jgi:hypothetical protein
MDYVDYKSFNVQIWVGLREWHTDIIHTIDDVRSICDKYVNEIGDCVTITPTEYRYVYGHEPGVIVGYINYPRFPRSEEEITNRALNLAERLRKGLNQEKVSVTTPDKTYMLETQNL